MRGNLLISGASARDCCTAFFIRKVRGLKTFNMCSDENRCIFRLPIWYLRYGAFYIVLCFSMLHHTTSLLGSAIIPALLTRTSIFFVPRNACNLSTHFATLFRSPRSRGREVTRALLNKRNRD